MSFAVIAALKLHPKPEHFDKYTGAIHRSIESGSMPAKVRAFRFLLGEKDRPYINPLNADRRRSHYNRLLAKLSKFAMASVHDPHEQADALLDVAYVSFAALLDIGLTPNQIEDCFAEIHASNMTKVGAKGLARLDEDGMAVKTGNYVRPRLEAALKG